MTYHRHRHLPRSSKVYLIFEHRFTAYGIRRGIKKHGDLIGIVYLCYNALLFAVQYERKECVNVLIELGADVNGVYLLRYAYHNECIARSLLLAGANGLGILHDDFAIRKVCRVWDDGDVRMIFQNIRGDVPQLDYILKVAAHTGRVLFVELLISLGAEVTEETLFIARKCGHTPLVDFLQGCLP